MLIRVDYIKAKEAIKTGKRVTYQSKDSECTTTYYIKNNKLIREWARYTPWGIDGSRREEFDNIDEAMENHILDIEDGEYTMYEN